MSALRAILGRFARFLVRLARKLDPGLAPAPRSLMSERMAALKLRYPGAPDHWLELVARSGMMPDAGPTLAHGPQPALDSRPEPHLQDAQSPRATQLSLRSPNGHIPRSALRFPILKRKAAAPAGLAPAITNSRPGPDAPVVPPRSVRTEPTFGTARARHRIANLLRGPWRTQRTARPQFLAEDGAPRTPQGPAEPDQSELVREEFHATFPYVDSRAASRPGWDAAADHRDSGELVAQVRWPAHERSQRTRTSWPNDTPRAPRHNPRFAAPDSRWPELPALLDEFDTPSLRASDEAALLAEQIGGTWSA